MGHRLVMAFHAAVLLVLLACPVARGEDPVVTAMYQPGTVDAIELTLPKASEEELEEHPTDDYVEGFLTLRETAGTPGTAGPPLIGNLKVGIRLKGQVLGSFRPLSGKAAFKIKCNFVKGAKCLGLKKMTLNNMVEDPSMIHETLSYAAFRAAGVSAPRTGYAYVSVNGADYGLYLNVETLDEVALKRLFGAFDEGTQHLYEAGYATDVTVGGAGAFEVDEGDDGDRGDLEALIAAVNSEGSPDWTTRVAPFADLGEMTRMWAVDRYIGHWDGYAGRQGTFQPNNYYLYSDPLGRFQMLPWGTDQTWYERLPFDLPAGLMFDRCLGDAVCALAYREALRSARDSIGGLGLDSLAAATAGLLTPWQAIDPRRESSSAEIAAAVAETRAFIAARPGEASEWLAAHGSGSPGASGGPSAGPGGRAMRFGRVWAARGVLRTRLRLLATAGVTQRVKVQTGDGPRTVCSIRVHGSAGARLTLRCPLSRALRHRSRSRPLRFTIVTRVAPDAGRPETVSRRLTLPLRGENRGG